MLNNKNKEKMILEQRESKKKPSKNRFSKDLRMKRSKEELKKNMKKT